MTSSTQQLTRVYEPFMHTFMKIMCGMAIFMGFTLVGIVYNIAMNQEWKGLVMVPFFVLIIIAVLKMYGPLRRVYATDKFVQIRLRTENLEIPFSELESVERPRWAPISNIGIAVVELKFKRETPRILLTIRDTHLDSFKESWKSAQTA